MLVDVQFKITGKEIPVDHGYRLYSAISGLIPELHGYDSVGILPIFGRISGDRKLSITPKSVLAIRVPSEKISLVLPLAGKSIQVSGNILTIGVPVTRALIPAARLYSHIVVIKGFMEPEPFLEAAQRQVDTLGIKGKPHLVPQPHIAQANQNRESGSQSTYLRRTIKIHDKEIVGFALRVEELNAEESILLQEKGIGGRRRFGCGVFIPERR